MANNRHNTEDIEPTRYGTAVVILLCIMAVLSVIAYGAVDTWATGLMALGATMIILL